jgi:uncharacterized protein YndB with AHSA1/START domain
MVVVADSGRSRSIAVQPQAVWDVLADFGSISTWADNVDHSCLLSHLADGVGVGTARRVQVGRNTLVERITGFDPPHALAYDIEGLPRRLGRIANRWSLQPAAGGGTIVTLTTTVRIGSRPLQNLAERVVCRVLAREFDTLLAGLINRWETARV